MNEESIPPRSKSARAKSAPAKPASTSSMVWVDGARPRTLPAALVPVAVGAGAAVATAGADAVVWWRVVGALLVSVLLQIGVNYANDYSDGVRGTDDVRFGPMRLVASGAASAATVKRAALVSFGAAGLVGLAVAVATSWWLLAVGAAAVAAAWGYTGGPRPYGYLGLGEVFVFIFFGVVATVGTTYVAIESLPVLAWVASVGVGSLACALLVINNLRDIPTDRTAGKRTLAVRLGAAGTRRLYAGFVAVAFVAAAIAALWEPTALLAWLAIPLTIPPSKAILGGAVGQQLISALGATGRLQLGYGLLLTVGLVL